MSYISSAKFLVRFDEIPILNRIDDQQLNSVGTSQLLQGVSGWNMVRSSYLYQDAVSVDIQGEFSIGFWLFPNNPGLIDNGSGTKPLRISVMDFGLGNINGDNTVSIHTPRVRILEETLLSGRNRLMVILNDIDYEVVSEEYEVRLWHHFWVSFDANASEFKIFIDGVESEIDESGSKPSSFGENSGIVSLNRKALDGNDVVNNNGGLDDVIITNKSLLDENEIIDIVNNGIIDHINDNSSENENVIFSVLFQDPDPTRILDGERQGLFFLSSSSDGKILKGEPVFWQSRKDFSNPQEEDVISKFTGDINIQNGYLRINQGSIEL